ncbi:MULTISPECIES: helix-turn-helix domain-containing protein [Chryseobacterium]|uniref:ATP-dependent DNA helicase PIF1 n=1 Tax=Chryseobacterium camelliae TaxID=1265445 RepID=A0ABU0TKA0_9FLAO|nr:MULTISPECIES: helix-turn-helix domain-containing protein [Chryseobacterium]MDT3408716.1 ATP-dependent DNA helicase PIF1 [Pseudacidovorax intermedius]MDQ1097431.1 ATP-dependent DNA helicase PIF1 [Chryseobacterium camelliae]MDQ1101359.1 ATP-dependent DNA helicase PIF1 [Chryseobacterium sp. SORGH_AS_1048]MDR6084804.1 ATP-dependent DNA helicase PIF1 [Chryseobacterium sp. SORGH_AS_0909]MDR6129151.1 ATP-dependent DNA helicase PIF1 [Chryseobacterium sp. SORGH_AS_1175]
MNNYFFDLIEHTNRSVFLTGKAGTGKTTFLNDFVKKTRKKHIVVAPTGIAAINAGGVTIHSMFGLPLRTFLPTTDRIDGSMANNIADLMPHFKYRKDKLKLLREVEVIIIDEVSMLRADVLDMMDFSLRFIRRNNQRFGGVQMLFIGDLYQLPPVVRDEHLLRQYYQSPFFFDSHAIKEIPLITIELTKVYRQSDEQFLDILNAIRDGDVANIDFSLLNQRYDPDFKAGEDSYVYLCSHNKMADEINQEKLAEIKVEATTYEAKLFGEFKENQFPNDQFLELKPGAQIMFIRNDVSPDKRYFNGKLGEISSLDENEIKIILEGSEREITVKREVWEQKKYFLDTDKSIKEEVLGSFEQFPVKLAWAVTIHKSQGLTFDRVIIDAGKSFTAGQVYVALSRCRTLEGIVLKSEITPEVIFKDNRILQFQGDTHANDHVESILNKEKYDYSIRKVLRTLDCLWFLQEAEEWNKRSIAAKSIDHGKANQLYTQIKHEIVALGKVFEKLERVIFKKVDHFISQQEEWTEIESKAKGAVNFFFTEIRDKIFSPLKDFYAEIKGVKGLKQYNEDFKSWLEDTEEYLNSLKDIHLLETKLLDEKNDKEVSMKIAKVPSQVLTFQLFEQGKTISEIALERGLVKETVIGHLAKFAEQGLLDISRVITSDKIKTFEELFKKDPKETLTEWKNALPSHFEFNEIRILINHFNYFREKSRQE